MVEVIEKKEFCKKYASKTHQKSIKSAAILSYICAAFFLVYGLYTNISVLLDVVLVVGLALGIQFAKSRVCAVLLLIYVCSNAIIAFLSSGKIEGWLLIAAGIEAVRGTFGLHKEYRKFLKDGTLPANEEYRKFPQSGTVGANVAPPQEALTKGKLSALFIPPLGMVAGLLVIMLSLSPFVLTRFVGNAPSPEALLQGYRGWYIAVLTAGIAAFLLAAVGSVIFIKMGYLTIMTAPLIVVSLILPLFLGGGMIVMENIPERISQANEDLMQIETGQLEEAVLWISPKAHSSRLPGPYAKNQPEPVMRYGGIGDKTDRKWVHFYVPDCLSFSLDQNALYNENMSIKWNKENARQYRFRYTSNFNLVVSADPVG